MKTKLLTACVAAALLAGCGSDGKDPQQQVQAFDGAIKGIQGTYTCTSGDTTESGVLPKTGFDGFSTVTASADSLLISAPESCVFTFTPTPGAVDVSNGKAMDQVALSIPRGLAGQGTKIAATPFTTLVSEALGDAEYTEASATTVLQNLGLGPILNSGVSVNDILTNLDGVISQLQGSDDEETKKLAGTLTATTHILTDVLVKKGTMDSTRIAEVAKGLADSVTASNPFYPASGADGQGSQIVVDAKEAADELAKDPTKQPSDVADKVTDSPATPVDPDAPATGSGSDNSDNGNG
ncbi:hypothetical protein [Vibrio cidicii]|uniref:hypothetical protein n=1 Tax=Vibrio cidicii TaxID=1763883 RepID=UPI0018C33AF9|nr:hypothetical protein [Vibrio cidicii]